MTVVNQGAGTDSTQYILRIGLEQWTRKTEADAWQKSPNTTVSLSPDQAAGILRYAASIEAAPDGHLTFTLDPARLGSGAGIARGDGELWLDSGKRIMKMILNFTSGVTGAIGEARSTLQLSDFDKPVEIARP
jgi:hypothetical protein